MFLMNACHYSTDAHNHQLDHLHASILCSELSGKLEQERLAELLHTAVDIEKEFAGEEGINLAAIGLEMHAVEKVR